MSINERKDKTGRIKEVDLNLSATEAQALAEVRSAIANEDPNLNDLRDATWARFLRHNSWSVAPAIAQVKEYLKWRAENNIDTIVEQGIKAVPNRDLIRTMVPYSYHGHDKDGRPIYFERTGMIATAALSDETILEPQSFIKSHIQGVELLQRRMYENSLARGERVNGVCTVLDMTGLGFHHRSCISTLKRCMDFDAKYYPEYLGKLYVINTPWVAPYLIQAVSVFLDDITKSRIHFVSGDPKEFLLSHIDADNLPVEYGGNCKGDKCECGSLGKNNTAGVKGCIDVLDSSNIKAEEKSGLDSVEISYEFEKLVESTGASGNDAQNEVFTWYFEVAGGKDIDFSVELLPVSGVRESDPAKRVYIRKVERLRVGKGTFKAPYPNAKLIFRWDNTFSWVSGKSLKYTVSCMNDTTHTMDELLHGGAGPSPTSSPTAASSSSSFSSEEQKQG